MFKHVYLINLDWKLDSEATDSTIHIIQRNG